MILFGNHCFLLLSTPFEVNILVIIGEIRVIALTKENMNKCNKYSKKKSGNKGRLLLPKHSWIFFTDKQYLIIQLRDFLGGPVAKTPYLHTPNVGDLGPNPGQGTRSHMLQLRPSTAK